MGKFYMERPIDSTQELVYTIADSSKIVFVDGISNVEELGYVVNWFKKNYVVLSLKNQRDVNINVSDVFIPIGYYVAIQINKRDNGFLDLKVITKEIEWQCGENIAFDFDEIFGLDMITEKLEKKLKDNLLTKHIIENFYGSDKYIVLQGEEECNDFTNYLFDNLCVHSIFLSEKNADRLKNRETMKEDFEIYCKYKNYKMFVDLDGYGVNIWIGVNNLGSKEGNMELIRWNELKRKLNKISVDIGME